MEGRVRKSGSLYKCLYVYMRQFVVKVNDQMRVCEVQGHDCEGGGK